METQPLPVCRNCVHFYITYDSSLPYGCKAMKFKSRENPAQAVFAASGMICQVFVAKSAKK